MKKSTSSLLKLPILFLLLAIGLEANAQEVRWLTWDEAIKLVETEKKPKKMFVDIYTDWCGWCKKMDKDTFQNDKVADYMSKNFYMVKIDGEGKEPLTYKGKTYKFVSSGRSGYHELAAALMQGRLSYPTTVFLDEKMNMLSPLPGYHKAEPFLNIAKYFGDNIYLEKDWKTYEAKGK